MEVNNGKKNRDIRIFWRKTAWNCLHIGRICNTGSAVSFIFIEQEKKGHGGAACFSMFSISS